MDGIVSSINSNLFFFVVFIYLLFPIVAICKDVYKIKEILFLFVAPSALFLFLLLFFSLFQSMFKMFIINIYFLYCKITKSKVNY